jgi:hypothetical protein
LTAFRTDKEIAAHLGISEATVKKHIHEACQRLGVNRRKAALAILEQTDQGIQTTPWRPRPPRGLMRGLTGGHTMGSFTRPLPQWSWDDLESALDRLNGSRRGNPLREHLLRRLKTESASASPVDLLETILTAGILISQTPSTTELRREDRSFG